MLEKRSKSLFFVNSHLKKLIELGLYNFGISIPKSLINLCSELEKSLTDAVERLWELTADSWEEKRNFYFVSDPVGYMILVA